MRYEPFAKMFDTTVYVYRNCLLICVLLLLASTSYDPREGRPVLTDYMERTKEFLNPAYDDAHKIVYQMVKRFGGKIPGRDN